MSDAVQASELIRDVVPVDAGATVGERILLTARKLGWPYYRTRDVWYEQARRIDAREMDALREAKRQREIKGAAREYHELRDRIARIEMALAMANPTLDRETLNVVQQQVRGLGRSDSSRDGEGQ